MLKTKINISPILLEIVEEDNMSIQYDIIRKQYNTAEFIPIRIIPNIIKYHFPSALEMHSFDVNHIIYKIKISDLLVANINNWEYNRPPDMSRCPDIARHIYNSKKPIDTMLYLSFNSIKDEFEVIDGIHRLTALKIIKDENSKDLELLCPGDFGSNNDANWLYDQYLIVNIRFNSNLGEKIDIFKTLNKAQAVPELYIKDYAREKREIIDSIANEWQIKYKKHFSSSSKPITGNTNRNIFIELLDKLYDVYKINETCSNKLRQKLDVINTQVSFDIPKKATIDIRLKCKETGCYLFLYKNDKLLEKYI